MGGQACAFYGAAEFSRDTDFAILADSANLARLRKALGELQAGVIAVPPFTTIELPDGLKCDLLALPDLVLAKKTQRDKD
jgi:hypothetical protein